MSWSCVLFDAVVKGLCDDCLLFRLTCVELFVLDIFYFFVDDIFCKLSLIGVLLVWWCYVELPCDVVDDDVKGVQSLSLLHVYQCIERTLND